MGTNDGGPAEPTTQEVWDSGFGGMSLRDWFAGMAMQGLCVDRFNTGTEGIARMAYMQADAMLAESNKERGAK